jgi:hypothetical protein
MSRDLLTTKEAAAVYGCTPPNLRHMAKRYAVRPACVKVLLGPDKRPRRYAFWRPRDVMRLRAQTSFSRTHCEGKKGQAVQRHRRAVKHHRLERLRHYYLTKLKERAA